MKLEFNYFIPTRIIFGAGKLKELATTRNLPGKKALIVISSGASMKRQGYLDRVIGYLNERGVQSVVFDKILPNPVVEHVAEGAALARQEGCDFVIGLGGGSSIDSAKAIAVMAKNQGELWDYLRAGTGKKMRPSGEALPIVAIPTTAGTGTEADPWMVITKTETKEKIGWGGDYSFPALSIVDPELMTSIPAKLTAYQGMDAFFHAVEGYLSTGNNPASDMFALDAIGLIAEYLPLAVKDGTNIEARSAVAWASTEAGFVESLSTLISHHSLEHAISGHHPDIPHGAGLTATSVAYFTCLAERNVSRLSDIARKMGQNVDRLSEAKKPLAFITALKKLIKNIGLEKADLASFGVKKGEASLIAQNALDTGGILFFCTPVQLGKEDVVKIFESCF
jgi:alcohol dehydrogenase